MKHIIIELLEENIEDLCDLGLDKDSLGVTPKIQAMKENLMNWILSKLNTTAL